MNCVHITHSTLIKSAFFMEIVFFSGWFWLLLLLLLLLLISNGIRLFRYLLVLPLLLRWCIWLILLVIVMLIVFIFCIHYTLIMFSLYHVFNHIILCFALCIFANSWFYIFKIHLVLAFTIITHPVSIFYLCIFFTFDFFRIWLPIY